MDQNDLAGRVMAHAFHDELALLGYAEKTAGLKIPSNLKKSIAERLDRILGPAADDVAKAIKGVKGRGSAEAGRAQSEAVEKVEGLLEKGLGAAEEAVTTGRAAVRAGVKEAKRPREVGLGAAGKMKFRWTPK